MPSISERILPELLLCEPGPERQRMLYEALNGSRTYAAALLSVIVATGLFVMWDKLIESVPSNWALFPLSGLCLIGFGFAIWFTRRDIRRRLRAQLSKKGAPICIPCGYNLTGNESGTCPECGTEICR